MEAQGEMQHQPKPAARNHRNVNRERLTRLKVFVRPDASAVAALLARIRRRLEALGPMDLSEAALRKLRNDGRS